MRDVSAQNFGYLIAFVLPGLVAVRGLALLDPTFADWFAATSADPAQPTVGGFLYVTLVAIAAGLTASTVRWLLIDTMHHWSGIRRPAWDDSKLHGRIDAFEALVTAHYRFYQFYANSIVSLVLVLVARLRNAEQLRVGSADLALMMLIILYWVGSRDTLVRYYGRAAVLLGPSNKESSHDQRTSPQGKEHPRRRRSAHLGVQPRKPVGGARRPRRGGAAA